MNFLEVLPYILVMAVATYLIRMLPLTFITKKITNRFVLSILYYLPYAVLSAMTIPAIFTATGHVLSGAIGFVVAFIAAVKEKSLIVVASLACGAAFIIELLYWLL